MCYYQVVVETRQYLDLLGRSPFAEWFDSLNSVAAAKVTTALVRLEQGNFSNAKGVGAGVYDAGLISAPATGCISARMERRS